MYDGAEDDSPLMRRYCGSSRPATQWSSGNTMKLHFLSDETVTKSGFTVKYTAQGKQIKMNFPLCNTSMNL